MKVEVAENSNELIYYVDGKEHTLFDLFTFLHAYNFIVDDKLIVFEQIEGNSPQLLINRINN